MRCQICDSLTENYDDKTTESICDECATHVEECLFGFDLEGDEDQYLLDEEWNEE